MDVDSQQPEHSGAGGPLVLGPEFKADAHAQYARLRAAGPVHRVQFFPGIEGWLVVDYALAREALTHPALLKDSRPAAQTLEAAGFIGHKPKVGLGGQMLEADPPQHTRLRRLVSSAFSPRRTAALAPRVEQIAHELIDAMPPSGELDLVEAFTAPLPIRVIAELLGIPRAHEGDFRRWSSLALQVAHPEYASSVASLHGLLADVIRSKRQDPADDLLSALVAVRDEQDGQLSEEELAGTAALLVIAGHETTVNLLGNAVLALLRHPDQMRLLRGSPKLMPSAVEEFLRYDTSVERTTHRYAAEDLELGGVRISRGAVVSVALASASRDAGLPDDADPATLDVTRSFARHLSFGHGIHYCLGAPLARLEATTALNILLDRVPDMELGVPAESLSWVPAGMMRGVLALPVRYARR